MTIEIEATLAVCCQDPDGVLDAVYALTALGPYRLEPSGASVLEDTYYDTPEGLLARTACALRTRRERGNTLVCVKKKERTTMGLLAEREETETPWCDRRFDAVARLLSEICPSRPLEEGLFDPTDPEATLARLGYFPVQSRQTVRRVLVARHGDAPPGEMTAKVCLDRVTYRIMGRNLVHREIEVEAGGGTDAAHAVAIAGLLRKRLGGVLFPWPHNKLLTGFAFSELASCGLLRPETFERGLSRGDYELISRRLSASP